jgi:hypothetical protein
MKKKVVKKIKTRTHEYYLVNFGSLTIPLKDIFVLKPLGYYIKEGESKVMKRLIIQCQIVF